MPHTPECREVNPILPGPGRINGQGTRVSGSLGRKKSDKLSRSSRNIMEESDRWIPDPDESSSRLTPDQSSGINRLSAIVQRGSHFPEPDYSPIMIRRRSETASGGCKNKARRYYYDKDKIKVQSQKRRR